MRSVNTKSVILGAVTGALIWLVWTSLITMAVLTPAYGVEQKAGHLFAIPRYGVVPFFLGWILAILLVSLIVNWLYAVTRNIIGAGVRTALLLGTTLGFVASVPVNLSIISWIQVSPAIPLFWMIDIWGGITFAIVAGAFCYKDRTNSCSRIEQ